MKIKELIEKLQKFDPETVVITRGFDEVGYADIMKVQSIDVSLRSSLELAQILGEYD